MFYLDLAPTSGIKTTAMTCSYSPRETDLRDGPLEETPLIHSRTFQRAPHSTATFENEKSECKRTCPRLKEHFPRTVNPIQAPTICTECMSITQDPEEQVHVCLSRYIICISTVPKSQMSQLFFLNAAHL